MSEMIDRVAKAIHDQSALFGPWDCYAAHYRPLACAAIATVLEVQREEYEQKMKELEAAGMIARNPAPDAAAPAVPTGRFAQFNPFR